MNARYWALMAACSELRGNERTSTGAYWEAALEALEDLRQEVGAELKAFNREEGMPDL